MPKKTISGGLLCAILGWVIFIVAVVHQVLTYGEQWKFGRYGMPVTLVAQDGLHYQDGRVLDPLNRYIVRTGYQPEVHLALTGLLLGCAVWLGRNAYQTYRMELELQRARQELTLRELELEVARRSR